MHPWQNGVDSGTQYATGSQKIKSLGPRKGCAEHQGSSPPPPTRLQAQKSTHQKWTGMVSRKNQTKCLILTEPPTLSLSNLKRTSMVLWSVDKVPQNACSET